MDTDRRQAFEQAQQAVLDRWQFEAESRHLDIPELGGRAHVLIAGEGPPVLMLNGIGTPAVMWAPLMARLGGFQLHAVDLPGYGLTAAPARQPADLREHAVSFLGEILDGLGLDRPAVVANSMGSLWSLWLAMERPEKVGPMVHVGCPALAPGTAAPLPMRLLSSKFAGPLLMRIQPPSSRQVEQLAKLVRQHPLPAEIAEAILATERMPGFEPTFRSNLNALVRIRGARAESALTEAQLATVRQPSLLIFGRRDPMGAERAARRMAMALPEAQLHMCEGGHTPWLDEPGRIAGWIRAFHATAAEGRVLADMRE